MPQTFSPQTIVMPEMAAPTAKCSQFARAISVEPRAPVKMGSFILTLVLTPYCVSVFTRGNRVLSEWPICPSGRPLAPRA
jgi:hypothetical protein